MNYEWVQPTLERIADLLRMPGVHNSYGTPKVNPGVAWETVRFIWPATNRCTPAPVVSPTEDGGFQFVWCGTESELRMIAGSDPNQRITVGLGGHMPISQESELSFKLLEIGLRTIERELGSVCPETVIAP